MSSDQALWSPVHFRKDISPVALGGSKKLPQYEQGDNDTLNTLLRVGIGLSSEESELKREEAGWNAYIQLLRIWNQNREQWSLDGLLAPFEAFSDVQLSFIRDLITRHTINACLANGDPQEILQLVIVCRDILIATYISDTAEISENDRTIEEAVEDYLVEIRNSLVEAGLNFPTDSPPFEE